MTRTGSDPTELDIMTSADGTTIAVPCLRTTVAVGPSEAVVLTCLVQRPRNE
jgi:hypothetical protein